MPTSTKIRADLLLVERKLAPSRARAQAEIEAGRVWSDGERVKKPSTELDLAADLELKGTNPFVSRGALKLEHALSHFAISLNDCVVIDIGASTGGFTEVALAHGASKVYAVDVGRGQLHERLAGEPRVVSLEGVNARQLGPDHVPELVDVLVCDVSFIGLEKALARAFNLAKERASLIALIKPQFEAGPGRVGKDGVLRDAVLHTAICDRISGWIAENGWSVLDVIESPIEGSSGNKEFLLAATKQN